MCRTDRAGRSPDLLHRHLAMQIGALGDIHGAFDAVHDIMARHPDVPLWVQVGDVASNDGEYFTPIRPLYWIKGNNEDFDVDRRSDGGTAAGADAALPAERRSAPGRAVARGRARRHVRAELVSLAGRRRCRRRAAGARRAASVKLGKSRDDKRRHFVREEVLACKALTGIDVFLTHEAPRPFYPAGRRIDAGQDGDQRSADVDASAAAPLRPPSRVHRLGAAGRPVDRPRPRDQVVPAHRRRDASLRATRYVSCESDSDRVMVICRSIQ